MQLSLILALFWTILASDIPAIKFPNGRIVGGYEVNPRFKYPWMASLAYNGRHRCGGTLYNTNTIISAAHCILESTSLWTARLSRHNLSTPNAPGEGKTYAIVSQIPHPKYDKKNHGYDVAIFKIDASAGVSTGVIIDPGKYSSTDDTLLKVIGWGTTSAGGSSSNVLLEVKVPVFNISKCKVSYSNLDTISQFCAGYHEGGKDSCQGDSGGPLFTEEGNTPVLVGIVSWGSGCAWPGFPGVYTRASAAADFIKQNA